MGGPAGGWVGACNRLWRLRAGSQGGATGEGQARRDVGAGLPRAGYGRGHGAYWGCELQLASPSLPHIFATPPPQKKDGLPSTTSLTGHECNPLLLPFLHSCSVDRSLDELEQNPLPLQVGRAWGWG